MNAGHQPPLTAVERFIITTVSATDGSKRVIQKIEKNLFYNYYYYSLWYMFSDKFCLWNIYCDQNFSLLEITLQTFHFFPRNIFVATTFHFGHFFEDKCRLYMRGTLGRKKYLFVYEYVRFQLLLLFLSFLFHPYIFILQMLRENV